jgi:hypothetical protein
MQKIGGAGRGGSKERICIPRPLGYSCRMNIAELKAGFKARQGSSRKALEWLFVPLAILLMGTGCFALGRLSALGAPDAVSMVADAPAAAYLAVSPEGRGEGSAAEPETGIPALAPGGEVVASKSGTKYHLPWCSGAKRINPANLVHFESAAAAKAAGYEPAANCKGL